MKYLLLLPLKFYRRFISPHMKAHCRYTPTCSAYAITAVERFGFFKGGYLMLRRLLRCNPFGGFGYDPVPEKGEAIRRKRNLKHSFSTSVEGKEET